MGITSPNEACHLSVEENSISINYVRGYNVLQKPAIAKTHVMRVLALMFRPHEAWPDSPSTSRHAQCLSTLKAESQNRAHGISDGILTQSTSKLLTLKEYRLLR
jgi:hypothetical protein